MKILHPGLEEDLNSQRLNFHFSLFGRGISPQEVFVFILYGSHFILFGE
jgi:hypothetical protein